MLLKHVYTYNMQSIVEDTSSFSSRLGVAQLFDVILKVLVY